MDFFRHPLFSMPQNTSNEGKQNHKMQNPMDSCRALFDMYTCPGNGWGCLYQLSPVTFRKASVKKRKAYLFPWVFPTLLFP